MPVDHPAAGARPDASAGPSGPSTVPTSVLSTLSAHLDGEADTSAGTRAMYGADASNYRRVPAAVVFPRSADDIATAVTLCADAGVPITMRGGGTSVAGNAIGPGIVLDTSRHLDRIIEIDPDARTARVQPGVVLASLQRAAGQHGLRFGPDPSTISRCTIGGMIGNNACGNHSVAWGTTADNVRELSVLTPDGNALVAGEYSQDQWAQKTAAAGPEGRLFRDLDHLVTDYRGLWRRELSPYSRRVSGYGVHHLLPENGRSVAKALVGSEGSCAVVLDATVALVAPPPSQILTVLGFPDDTAAADAVPAILAHHPLTVEGLDAELLAAVGGSAGDGLPPGQAWLFVELGAETAEETAARIHALLRDLTPAGPSSLIVDDERQRAALWKIRKDGAGLATRDVHGNEAWPGWEDAAVPPEQLGSYLRVFRGLLRRYDLRGLSYGHFGEGCIHVRINFDLLTADGVTRFRSFIEEAADAVVEHGGSLSGEHGDGMARSGLLARMYSPEMIQSFAGFTRAFDPSNVLNPGIVVDPPAIDDHLRYRGPGPVDLPAPRLHYPEDDGDFARAVRRCVGVGKCRSADGAVMCPSWHATGEEKHSTRGRARLLQEIASGDAVTDGWRSEDAREALDLCLACKGCSSDCPVGVDMAVYKAEFLHQHYRRRRRPLSHYSMGWLPVMARFASRMPRLVNAVTRSRWQGLLKKAGGIDDGREIPPFAARSFRASTRRAGRTGEAGRAGQVAGEAGQGTGEPTGVTAGTATGVGAASEVVLWPDTFGNYLTPEVLHAGRRVLEAAGMTVRFPDGGVCCGLTWFSTGQLGVAERVLKRTGRALESARLAGLPVVVLEPSCAAMLRSESAAVLGETDLTRYLQTHVVTLAEALEQFAPDWQPPHLDVEGVGQIHCHQSSVLGFDADRRLMRRSGIDSLDMQDGCCGLAGNFGFEDGHLEISTTVAEHQLMPALREASADRPRIADGYSCRTQISQLGGGRARHLAELLADALPDQAAELGERD